MARLQEAKDAGCGAPPSKGPKVNPALLAPARRDAPVSSESAATDNIASSETRGGWGAAPRHDLWRRTAVARARLAQQTTPTSIFPGRGERLTVSESSLTRPPGMGRQQGASTVLLIGWHLLRQGEEVCKTPHPKPDRPVPLSHAPCFVQRVAQTRCRADLYNRPVSQIVFTTYCPRLPCRRLIKLPPASCIIVYWASDPHRARNTPFLLLCLLRSTQISCPMRAPSRLMTKYFGGSTRYCSMHGALHGWQTTLVTGTPSLHKAQVLLTCLTHRAAACLLRGAGCRVRRSTSGGRPGEVCMQFTLSRQSTCPPARFPFSLD